MVTVWDADLNTNATQAETVLRWTSVAGKSYAIEKSTDLTAGFYELVADVLATPPVEYLYGRESAWGERGVLPHSGEVGRGSLIRDA